MCFLSKGHEWFPLIFSSILLFLDILMMKMIATQKMKVTGTVNHEIMIIVFKLGEGFYKQLTLTKNFFTRSKM